jgi:hypothetical protein
MKGFFDDVASQLRSEMWNIFSDSAEGWLPFKPWLENTRLSTTWTQN